MKTAESYPNGWKTLREKEKLLVTSNFSFSHSVFKRLVLQTSRNQGLFGKGLMNKNFSLETPGDSRVEYLQYLQVKILLLPAPDVWQISPNLVFSSNWI